MPQTLNRHGRDAPTVLARLDASDHLATRDGRTLCVWRSGTSCGCGRCVWIARWSSAWRVQSPASITKVSRRIWRLLSVPRSCESSLGSPHQHARRYIQRRQGRAAPNSRAQPVGWRALNRVVARRRRGRQVGGSSGAAHAERYAGAPHRRRGLPQSDDGADGQGARRRREHTGGAAPVGQAAPPRRAELCRACRLLLAPAQRYCSAGHRRWPRPRRVRRCPCVARRCAHDGTTRFSIPSAVENPPPPVVDDSNRRRTLSCHAHLLAADGGTTGTRCVVCSDAVRKTVPRRRWWLVRLLLLCAAAHTL
jgi:hypothetical protein